MDEMTEQKCSICATDLKVFFEATNVPVYCNVLWPSKEAAVSCQRGDISLGYCSTCGFITNVVFDESLLTYTEAYENSLHFSARFREYAMNLAKYLVERHKLCGKEIIEIGCGKGDFLRLLCKLGRNRGIGFDPSYAGGRETDEAMDRITFIKDVYSEKYSDYSADLIYCRHVLEHIASPRDFLTTLRRATGRRKDTGYFFEVPNIAFTLRDLGIWDLIYEHCSYFSGSSLVRLFSSCGFQVSDLYETFEGQFLCIEALFDKNRINTEYNYRNDVERMDRDVVAFSDRYRNKVEKWKHNLINMNRLGKKVVVWGGGSKGVTFLNALNVDEQIQYIVDINPYKQGKYAPGTGQEIVAPEFLREYRPDSIIAMNPVYISEIRQMVERMDITPEIIPV